MQKEFELNMQMRQMEMKEKQGDEKYKEDRKDDRVRLQSEEKAKSKRFESAGNDALGTGLNMNQF